MSNRSRFYIQREIEKSNKLICTKCIYTDQVHNTEPCLSCEDGSNFEIKKDCNGCFGASFGDCEDCEE